MIAVGHNGANVVLEITDGDGANPDGIEIMSVAEVRQVAGLCPDLSQMGGSGKRRRHC